MNRIGLLKVERHDDRGKIFELQNWCVQDDDQHRANCRFFAAAPAMAEALEMWDRWFWSDKEEKAPIDETRAALLAAGYTETTES